MDSDITQLVTELKLWGKKVRPTKSEAAKKVRNDKQD